MTLYKQLSLASPEAPFSHPLRRMGERSSIFSITKEFWYEYQRISGRFDTKQY